MQVSFDDGQLLTYAWLSELPRAPELACPPLTGGQDAPEHFELCVPAAAKLIRPRPRSSEAARMVGVRLHDRDDPDTGQVVVAARVEPRAGTHLTLRGSVPAAHLDGRPVQLSTKTALLVPATCAQVKLALDTLSQGAAHIGPGALLLTHLGQTASCRDDLLEMAATRLWNLLGADGAGGVGIDWLGSAAAS